MLRNRHKCPCSTCQNHGYTMGPKHQRYCRCIPSAYGFCPAYLAENTSHIANVGTVHTDKQIVFIVVACFKLNGSFTA